MRAKRAASTGLSEANLLEARAIFVQARGASHKETRGSVQGLVDFDTAWDGAEPGNGYDTKAAEWKAKAEGEKGAQDRVQRALLAPGDLDP